VLILKIGFKFMRNTYIVTNTNKKWLDTHTKLKKNKKIIE